MNPYQLGVSQQQVSLPRHDLRMMIRLVRTLQQLSERPEYRKKISSQVSITGRFDPGHYSVMMGYDFHLAPDGPRLIEINTNNGGAWLACLACNPDMETFPAAVGGKILNTFRNDYALWKNQPEASPKNIVIMDEHPEEQYLYKEMQVFAELFRQAGIKVTIVDPGKLDVDNDGVYYNGKRIDLIYNRHCDFYLHQPEMTKIRTAWMAKKVCLSPNPHTYALLADKQRMILWSDPEQRAGLGFHEAQEKLLDSMVLPIRLMNTFDFEELWKMRKQWVFKPVSSYACKGVYVGKKITRKKFAELDPESTVVQRLIPPSITPNEQGKAFKTDYRLFTYRDQVLGITARLYQGQVTNLQTEDGGFASVKLV